MKTLRALFWGCIAGVALGYLFAPRDGDLARAGQGAPRGAAATGAYTGGRAAATSGGMSGGMSGGRFVGNTHTKIYHEPGDTNLPSEENRTYFESAAAAEAAGYKPAGHMTAAG